MEFLIFPVKPAFGTVSYFSFHSGCEKYMWYALRHGWLGQCVLVGGKNLGSDECLEKAGTGHNYADSDQRTMYAFGSYHIDGWQPWI